MEIQEIGRFAAVLLERCMVGMATDANPDVALLRDIQVPLKETEEILRFAELCMENIEI